MTDKSAHFFDSYNTIQFSEVMQQMTFYEASCLLSGKLLTSEWTWMKIISKANFFLRLSQFCYL